MKKSERETIINGEKAYNLQFLFKIVILVICIIITISILSEKQLESSIIAILLDIVLIISFLFSPIYYIFNEERVEIVYLLGMRENVRWEQIAEIRRHTGSRGDRPFTYYLFYEDKFYRPFYMNGEITKSRRTTLLLKKYSDKSI